MHQWESTSEGSLETIMIMTDCQALVEMAANTLCLKNDNTLRCYNSDSHKPILIIFGRNVPERVENQQKNMV